MSEKELTILERLDEILNDENNKLLQTSTESTLEIDVSDLKEFRDELFAKLNYITSLQDINKQNIEDMNVKVERIIELREMLEQGNAANREMFITLQHVGAIFNKMFDDISEASKDTDFVDAGAITKILNNNKKFEVDESVFEEEVLIEHTTDTSFKG